MRGSKYRPPPHPARVTSAVSFQSTDVFWRDSLRTLGSLTCHSWEWRDKEPVMLRDRKGIWRKYQAQDFSPIYDSSSLITQFIHCCGLPCWPQAFCPILCHSFSSLGWNIFSHTVQLNLFHHQHIFLCPMDSLKGILWRCVSIQTQAFV